MKSMYRMLTLGVAFISLASCGGDDAGGGGTGGGGTGGGNRAPVFVSPANISFVEYTEEFEFREVVQLAATDADNDEVTFEIVAGKDSELLSFYGGNGSVFFDDPVSFETPKDANGDNVYEIDVRASDGKTATLQTIRITVTNDKEGLVVNELASGLGANANIIYDFGSDRVLVIDEAGNIASVDPETGAVIRNATTMNFGGGKIVDVTGSGGGKFHALAKWGKRIRMLEVDSVTSETTIKWDFNLASEVNASMATNGSGRWYVALSDGGDRDAAQDRSDPRGNVMLMHTSYANGTYFFTASPIGTGLHDPRFPSAPDVDNWTIDRGETLNEINNGAWDLSQSRANYEWPKREGFTATGWSGTLKGNLVSPQGVQAIGTNGAGRWMDAADGLQHESWLGRWILPDDQGNIWSWHPNDNGHFENRNLDFGITDPSPDKAFISMTRYYNRSTRVERVLMMRADGTLFGITAER